MAPRYRVVSASRRSRPHRRVGITARCRHPPTMVRAVRRSFPFLRTHEKDVVRVDADEVVHLLLRSLRLGRPAGRSCSAGTISRPASSARNRFDSVPAPGCPATRRPPDAPSHAANERDDLVREVHVAGRVDDFQLELLPVARRVCMRTALSLMVMPRSRSRSSVSSTCPSSLSLLERAGDLDHPSARVDFP